MPELYKEFKLNLQIFSHTNFAPRNLLFITCALNFKYIFKFNKNKFCLLKKLDNEAHETTMNID